jgi:hypothetical protein
VRGPRRILEGFYLLAVDRLPPSHASFQCLCPDKARVEVASRKGHSASHRRPNQQNQASRPPPLYPSTPQLTLLSESVWTPAPPDRLPLPPCLSPEHLSGQDTSRTRFSQKPPGIPPSLQPAEARCSSPARILARLQAIPPPLRPTVPPRSSSLHFLVILPGIPPSLQPAGPRCLNPARMSIRHQGSSAVLPLLTHPTTPTRSPPPHPPPPDSQRASGTQSHPLQHPPPPSCR